MSEWTRRLIEHGLHVHRRIAWWFAPALLHQYSPNTACTTATGLTHYKCQQTNAIIARTHTHRTPTPYTYTTTTTTTTTTTGSTNSYHPLTFSIDVGNGRNPKC